MRRGRSLVFTWVLGGVLAACAAHEPAREPVMTSRPVEVQNLIGSEWLAEDIDGGGVVDNSHSTLHFAAADHVDGDTGCNRFMGPLAVDGQNLRIGPLATTRRACAPALLDQERRYLVALARGSGLRLDGALLVLLDESQRPLVRYSQVEPSGIPTRP